MYHNKVTLSLTPVQRLGKEEFFLLFFMAQKSKSTQLFAVNKSPAHDAVTALGLLPPIRNFWIRYMTLRADMITYLFYDNRSGYSVVMYVEGDF